jgi:hypothetical protein
MGQGCAEGRVGVCKPKSRRRTVVRLPSERYTCRAALGRMQHAMFLTACSTPHTSASTRSGWGRPRRLPRSTPGAGRQSGTGKVPPRLQGWGHLMGKAVRDRPDGSAGWMGRPARPAACPRMPICQSCLFLFLLHPAPPQGCGLRCAAAQAEPERSQGPGGGPAAEEGGRAAAAGGRVRALNPIPADGRPHSLDTGRETAKAWGTTSKDDVH